MPFCFVFFFFQKLFLFCWKPESWEAEIVNRDKLWPHRHHRTRVPSCSWFLAWAVQGRPWRLRRNHVGPYLRGYWTSLLLLSQLTYNSFFSFMRPHVIYHSMPCLLHNIHLHVRLKRVSQNYILINQKNHFSFTQFSRGLFSRTWWKALHAATDLLLVW